MLSELACRRARPGPRPYRMTDGHGLHLYVTPTGSKVWRWRDRVAGREQTHVIGRYPAIGLADARQLAQAARAALQRGETPCGPHKRAAAATVAPAGPPLRTVALDWWERQRVRWAPVHADDVRASLERDAAALLDKPAADVTIVDVLAALRAVEARGAIDTAHRLRQRSRRSSPSPW